MEQYISKAATMAEIERLKVHSEEAIQEFGREGYIDNVLYEQSKIRICEALLTFLDTIEVKEVEESTAADRGVAEEIIINLKRVEHDYHIDLTNEMEWIRNKSQKGVIV